jgi:hypothetical protein
LIVAVYFIQALDGGPIKIGHTTRLSIRLKQIAKEFGKRFWVLGVIDGARDAEKALHERFAHLRIGGEWFKPASDLHECIAKEAKSWDGTDEVACEMVAIDAKIMKKVKMIAGWRGLSISDCLSALLRHPAEVEFDRVYMESREQVARYEEAVP